MDNKTRIELESQKKRWEDKVKTQNEDKERKEREKKSKIEEKKMEEFRKRLEEKNAKGRKLLEEERLMFGKQEVAETSRTVDVEETQMDESRDTEYNLLDSMVNPKEKDPQLLEDMLGNERTIPQTPLIEGVSGNLGYDETMNDER